MKKALLALALLATAAAIVWAQPKVAVLDAIIPQNMDPSVISPATDKIIEKLVQSNRFTVLDRANIENVLKEREFQVSGMVSDQDAVTAGKYLGADFIVVSKISKVGDTNFISGKMINVKTGVIVSTTSAQGDGKLAVIITLAGQVGEVLAGGTATAAPAPDANVVVVAPPPSDTIPVAPAPPAPAKPYRSSSGDFSYNFIGVGLYANTYTNKGESESINALQSTKYHFVSLALAGASKYIQFSLGMSWFTSASIEFMNISGETDGTYDYAVDYSMTYMNLNFMFRLPLKMGSSMALVPLAGFEYDLNLSVKDELGNDVKTGLSTDQQADLNHFLLQIGVALQINVGNLVVYPELIYGWKIKSNLDTDWETANSSLGDFKVSSGQLTFGCVVGFGLN